MILNNTEKPITLIATCPEEIKEIVEAEIHEFGGKNIRAEYMCVVFEVDEKDFYRAHLYLSTPSTLLVVLRSFSAKNQIMLNSQAKRIHWEKIFSPTTTYRVDAIAGDRGPEFMTSNEISKTVRLSIEDMFMYKGLPKPKVNLEEPEIIVSVYVRQNKAVVSINTSGKSLHKRGYRISGHAAPMKETLAAALLRYCNYTGDQVLFDPMCGSGTLIIEGAFMALKKACLIHRKKGDYGFEYLMDFNRNLWRQVQEEARLEKQDELRAKIYGSDISSEYAELTKTNALRARVEKYLEISAQDFFTTQAPAPKGLLVMNLPYGQRIKEDLGFQEFYKKIGDHLKKNFAGWRIGMLVSEESPWGFIGLKPLKKKVFLNGSIKARFLVFEIVEGKFKPTQDLILSP